ncbi:MAG: response regulator [Planctomycetaceae bacterium]|nr:response regulator [Planctomycetaceae bacterium]
MTPTRTPRRILVVEDDPQGGAVIEAVLAGGGYEVRVVRDGTEALGAARDFAPHLIVTDVCMPGMNGIDTMVALQPRKSGIPVIIVSGAPFSSPLEPYELSEALGASRFLPKPFRRGELLATVRELLP